ncbi:Translocase subunit seca [Quillaja saponaria]|uniref:Translocase subunit seca n=1 Tax=Quillaja saponaria TaxID=32244 RepID=A0AAD7Q5B5_QUISA|nr:Translocase subunit seca [Quillaja saponaria]KAJ7975125.1 Translocase subunit seca [Quillaja saponaria]
MNRCVYLQNAVASCEEMRMDTVVCPKPRRLCVFSNSSINDHIRPLRWPINHQSEIGDSKGGAELLDMILPKGSYSERSGSLVASSPPFFSGSPPSRASNPVIQDEQFGNDNFTPISPAPSSPSASSARKSGGCVRMKFGQKPAAVRVEGFDCLSRDRRNCSISAVA